VSARRGGRNAVQPFERGPKDVVYIGENEQVDVIARFGPQGGRYMMHCHNLVHEDHDMMHQFWVKPAAGSGQLDEDPMGSRADTQDAGRALRLPPVPGQGPQFPPAVTT
jgi:multicopper oxidase